MKVLDLFSGVGMFAYGMEKAGHEVVAFCEIEEWPRRVLDKHWPDVPKYTDVRELNRERLEEDGVISHTNGKLISGCQRRGSAAGNETADEARADVTSNGSCQGTLQPEERQDRRAIDIITGGFPCQDLSVAGKQAGIHGERSGLFDEIIRLACELRPRYIVLENVAALLTGDSGGWARYVFGRLTEIGFDAEWHVIPAGNPDGLSAGAPHRRERVWIVAYSEHNGHASRQNTGRTCEAGENQQREMGAESVNWEPAGQCDVAYPQCQQDNEERGDSESRRDRVGWAPETAQQYNRATNTDCTDGYGGDVAYPSSEGLQGRHEHDGDRATGQTGRESDGHTTEAGTDAGQARPEITIESNLGLLADGITAGLAGLRWLPEPRVGRVATGVPYRVQKLKALGNGLVWQVPYVIGRAILEADLLLVR